MLCSMSSSADRSGSERINRVLRQRFAETRLQRVAVDHVYGLLEKAGDVILKTDVIEHGHPGLGIELHQNVDIAVRAVVAARDRAEQRSVPDPPGGQAALISTQGIESILGVHL